MRETDDKKGLQRPKLPIWVQLDLPLLTKEHEKSPEDTRIVFYLAQTYHLIGDTEKALAMYQKRIDMRGWLQEVFESHLRRVRLCSLQHTLFALCGRGQEVLLQVHLLSVWMWCWVRESCS